MEYLHLMGGNNGLGSVGITSPANVNYNPIANLISPITGGTTTESISNENNNLLTGGSPPSVAPVASVPKISIDISETPSQKKTKQLETVVKTAEDNFDKEKELFNAVQSSTLGVNIIAMIIGIVVICFIVISLIRLMVSKTPDSSDTIKIPSLDVTY